MAFEMLRSPVSLLKYRLGDLPHEDVLSEYQAWWEAEGKAISAAVDRAGTPWVRTFDSLGRRIDEVVMPPDYWRMLRRGYQAGVVWRALKENSLIPSYLLDYATSFYDPGLDCPYTVSLSTALPFFKYGRQDVKDRYLPPLLRQDETVWQGATWMTEVKGGSDLGATVETVARQAGDHWLLTGDKYFASNAGAELAVVAARPEGAPENVRGLGLFLLPRYDDRGRLNYVIRRMKDKIATRSVPTGEVELRDSVAYLLGRPEWGIYLILEVLNLSRVANSMGSIALAQRAMADALYFAERRFAFGKPIVQHPLLRRQFDERVSELQRAFALAWEAVKLLDEVWRETPPYSGRYHLSRLVTHLAKYWTAEFAVQTAKWAMEVHGGMGVLAEHGVERWLREAMILDIWEGPPHRQILDGLEAMERKGAHRTLFGYLEAGADPQTLADMTARVEQHLSLPMDQKEARAQELFAALAAFTADSLLQKMEP